MKIWFAKNNFETLSKLLTHLSDGVEVNFSEKDE